MKLEVGMYARLHGKIGEITHICMCEQCKLRGFYEPVVDFGHGDSDYISVYWKDDLKASNNIIDLIEVGDYVNGFRVDEIGEYHSIRTDKVETYAKVNCSALLNCFYEEDIKSIVTKEQFESMSYKVGE